MDVTLNDSAIAAALAVRGSRLMAIQVDDWMFAPDGQQYRVIFGLAQVLRAKDLLGFEPRNSANWWVMVGEGEGSMLIAGCKIHFAQEVSSKPAGSHVYEVKSADAIEIICNPSPAQKAGEQLLDALKRVARCTGADGAAVQCYCDKFPADHVHDFKCLKAKAAIAAAEVSK